MIIAIVSPHASHYLGGMEVVTLHMARQLARAGAEVRFFTRQSDTVTDVYEDLLSEANERLRVIEVPLPGDTPLPDGTWPTFYRISCDFGLAAHAYYRQHSDADMFITHLSTDSLFVPRSHPNILHLHGSPDVIDPLMQAAISIPRATIAHSLSIMQWWVSQFPHLKPTVFQNGIATESFTGDPSANRPIDILYVGRFLEHKGIDDILRAARPGQVIAIAGHGSYLPALRDIAYKRGLEDSITFYDTPSTETIRKLYGQAKIFACPSRGREGVLTTLLEAGASGCAVVTTSGAGMTDVVRNDVNGLVVAPGDVSALQNAFTTLLDASFERRLTLATALQTELRRDWSWNVKAAKLMEIYRAAL